jgi:hypothetical protein
LRRSIRACAQRKSQRAASRGNENEKSKKITLSIFSSSLFPSPFFFCGASAPDPRFRTSSGEGLITEIEPALTLEVSRATQRERAEERERPRRKGLDQNSTSLSTPTSSVSLLLHPPHHQHRRQPPKHHHRNNDRVPSSSVSPFLQLFLSVSLY